MGMIFICIEISAIWIYFILNHILAHHTHYSKLEKHSAIILSTVIVSEVELPASEDKPMITEAFEDTAMNTNRMYLRLF